MKKIYMSLLLSVFITVAFAQSPASLDSAFGNNGIAVFNKPMQSLPQVKCEHLLQPDGKIIICSNSLTDFFTAEVMVTRYNSGGTLDYTFGDSGTFHYNVKTGFNLAVGLELQPDGKIVTSGIYNDGNGTVYNETFILRLNTNGTLDTTFGTAGISHWDISREEERVTDMKRMSDGSFVISGIISTTVSADSGFVLKIRPDGRLDSTFANNGLFRYQHNGNQTDLYAIEVMPDKSLIAGGSTYTSGGTYQNVFLIKLDSIGALFTSFGNGGIVNRDLYSDYDEVHTIKRLSNGDLLVSGYAYDDISTYNDGTFVMKLNANGTSVNTFGVNGIAYFSTPNTPNRSYDMDVQANGKIVLAGHTYSNTTYDDDYIVWRLLANGTPDTSFNHSQAYVTLDFLNEYDNASSVLVQPDGKLLVYGTAVLDVTAQDLSPVLVRYMGGESGGTLALDLLTFSGTAAENNIVLKWITDHEKNNDYFTVQKSNDAITFKDLSKIYGKNSSGMNNYSYTDENPQTTKSYYRLKIADKDGKVTYSKTVSFPAKNSNSISVFPTITNSYFSVQTNRREKLYLFNSNGQVVKEVITGGNDISSLPAGIYYIKASEKVIMLMKQ